MSKSQEIIEQEERVARNRCKYLQFKEDADFHKSSRIVLLSVLDFVVREKNNTEGWLNNSIANHAVTIKDGHVEEIEDSAMEVQRMQDEFDKGNVQAIVLRQLVRRLAVEEASSASASRSYFEDWKTSEGGLEILVEGESNNDDDDDSTRPLTGLS